MSWLMLIILVLIVVLVVSGGVTLIWLGFMVLVKKEGPIYDRLKKGRYADTRLLTIPFTAWALLFLLLLLMLLFVSAMCLMYAFALFHGEWFVLLDNVPKTAGNVLVNMIYPIQMILFAMITFFLAVGGFQAVFGPVDALNRFRLRINDVRALTRNLAGLIAIASGLEVVKILFYGLLVEPNKLSAFFALDTLPKAEPIGVGLIVLALLILVAAAIVSGKDRK